MQIYIDTHMHSYTNEFDASVKNALFFFFFLLLVKYDLIESTARASVDFRV